MSVSQCRLIKGKIFQTPFDYAQGDSQTERSRSLF